VRKLFKGGNFSRAETIWENTVLKRLKFSKYVSNKKYGPKTNKINLSRKTRVIFDTENWLWKSEIGTFQSLNSCCTLIYWRPFKVRKCYLPFNWTTIWCGSYLKFLKWTPMYWQIFKDYEKIMYSDYITYYLAFIYRKTE